MGNTIKITSQQLSDVSASLTNGSEDVAMQLLQMASQVKALVDADWGGQTPERFRELWDQWQSGAANIKEALDGIAQMLKQAGYAYEQTEAELSRSMGR